MVASVDALSAQPNESLQAAFLALLPKLQTHARIFFRHVKCPVRKEDAIQEAVALAWKWHCRLAERGKDVSCFPRMFIRLVTRAIQRGGRLCGQEKARDVLSPRSQRLHGFRVESLSLSAHRASTPRFAPALSADVEERLRENSQTPVLDQVAFRLDWPSFFQTLTDRDRRLAGFLALGHSATRAASQFHLSPGRVTQLRQDWCRAWRRFQGEELQPTALVTSRVGWRKAEGTCAAAPTQAAHHCSGAQV